MDLNTQLPCLLRVVKRNLKCNVSDIRRTESLIAQYKLLLRLYNASSGFKYNYLNLFTFRIATKQEYKIV